MVVNSRSLATDDERQSRALVIFSRVEGLLRERTHDPSVAACDPLRFLASQDVPLVLVSAWPASEVRQLQNEFGFHQPFICDEGAALHVPASWLREVASMERRGEQDIGWEVFRFSPASIGAAFELVTAMFMARGYDPLLTVGIGCDLADYNLLRAVDIPIAVRARDESQRDLLRRLPGLYVTSASGAAGWSEAVFGGPH